MASVLLSFENQGEDKHVESVLLPRSDTGSIPVSSTFIILSWEALKCEAMTFTHEKRVQVPSQLHNKNNYKVHRFKPFTRFKDPVNEKSLWRIQHFIIHGSLAEWSIVAVLKIAVLKSTEGSNPSDSAFP